MDAELDLLHASTIPTHFLKFILVCTWQEPLTHATLQTK
jgi:hypothetical protein